MSAAPAVVLAHAGTDDRRMYAEYLRAHGFRVHEAETTDAALELIENCQLVITGLMVPGSIGGVDLIARIRQEHSAVPIIVVTACVLANVLDAAKTAGCDELLIKPCFPEHLLESVRRLLEVPPPRRQNASSN
jgi:two-component system, cell cycle response regulator DivK